MAQQRDKMDPPCCALRERRRHFWEKFRNLLTIVSVAQRVLIVRAATSSYTGPRFKPCCGTMLPATTG